MLHEDKYVASTWSPGDDFPGLELGPLIERWPLNP